MCVFTGMEICSVCEDDPATQVQLENLEHTLRNIKSSLDVKLEEMTKEIPKNNEKNEEKSYQIFKNLDDKMEKFMKTELEKNPGFTKLNSRGQNLLIKHAVIRINQNSILNNLNHTHKLILKLQQSVELGHFITLYGDDIQKLEDFWDSFYDMTTDNFGGIGEYLENVVCKKMLVKYVVSG